MASTICSLLITGCKQDSPNVDEVRNTASAAPMPNDSSQPSKTAEAPAEQLDADRFANSSSRVDVTPTPAESSPSEPDEAISVAFSDGNTAGGIGQARMKEKTLTEGIVPEEARKLTDAAMQKIPPVLNGLRESGRLNWKMGELNDDVLVLNWKQEQFVLESRNEMIDYLNKTIEVYDAVWDRMLGASWGLDIYVSDHLLKGEFVHPEFRKWASEKGFLKTPTSLSTFLETNRLRELEGKFEHPLFKLKSRLVAQDLRRSDLFYMLAAYRIATEDYARILEEEAEFDRVMAIPRFLDLCYKDGGYMTIRYARANGYQVEEESRGHLYLPRNHQENFERAHGRYYPKKKTKLDEMGEAFDLLNGNAPEREENSGSLSDQIFRKPLPEVPEKEFLTTEEQPKQRDSLSKQRASLDKRMVTLIELLGEEWAEFDFPPVTIVGEDTYFTQRVLMDEIAERRKELNLSAFRKFMERLTAKDSFEKREEIADEYLSPEHAATLAEYIQDASPKTYNGPYTGPDEKFRMEDLTEEIQMAYKAVVGAEDSEFFSKPLPDDLLKAVQLVSQGEHLVADGDNDAALEKFKAAHAMTKLSDARLKHFAKFCRANSFAGDATIFWSGPLDEEPK